jgi:hypothetical protein
MCYSLDEEVECDVICCQITAIISNSLLKEKYLPPTWSISYWELIIGADLRLSLIIHRVTVKWDTKKQMYFLELITWKLHRKELKICSGPTLKIYHSEYIVAVLSLVPLSL